MSYIPSSVSVFVLAIASPCICSAAVDRSILPKSNELTLICHIVIHAKNLLRAVMIEIYMLIWQEEGQIFSTYSLNSVNQAAPLIKISMAVIQYNSLSIHHFISLPKFQTTENSDRQKNWFIGFCLSTALYPFSFVTSLCEPHVCVHKLPAPLHSGWLVTVVQVKCMLLMISPTARWHGTVRVVFKFLPLCIGTQWPSCTRPRDR